jgi:hypothetical protein
MLTTNVSIPIQNAPKAFFSYAADAIFVTD